MLIQRKKIPSGFTFVELSVALIIISLLTTGILAGRYLLAQSRMQSLIKQQKNVMVSVNLFKQYYGGLPGDLANATTFWPDDLLYEGFSTSDGNGDHVLTDEELLAWQHLSLANMIPSTHGGSLDDEHTEVHVGAEIPTTPYNGVGMFFLVDTSSSPYTNALGIAGNTSINENNIYLEGGALTSYQAVWIDNKQDDGSPTNGNIRGFSENGVCITAEEPNEYTTDDEIIDCYLWFYLEPKVVDASPELGG